MKRLIMPCTDDAIATIEAGDEVIISGVIYTGRDQVHKRLASLIGEGKEPPFPFRGNAIYYMGPSPAPDGFALGVRYLYLHIGVRRVLEVLERDCIPLGFVAPIPC